MTANQKKTLTLMSLGGLMMAGCSQARFGHAGSQLGGRSATVDPADMRVTGPSNLSTAASASEQPPQNEYGTETITLAELREHIQNGTAVVVDARSPDQFARGHVRGAINLPASDKIEEFRQQQLASADPEQLVIVYCSSATCHSADMVAEHLLAHGHTNVRVFTPGWVILASAKNIR